MSNDSTGSPRRGIDYFDPAFRSEHEWQVYRDLREEGELAYSPENGEWWAVGYEACRHAFQDHELFSNDLTLPPGTGPALVREKLLPIPVYVDPPEHRQYKRLLDPLFSARRMALLETEIREFAAELIDPLRGLDRCDLAESFTIPFPTIIFCRLMGFPLEDHAKLMWWKDLYLNGSSTFVAAKVDPAMAASGGRLSEDEVIRLKREATTEISDYLTGLIEDRRLEPADDLLTQLLELQFEDERPLSEEELVLICWNLFLGGLDTVSGVLGHVIRDLAEDPERRREFVALIDDPASLAIAVEELLRYESLVPMPRRVTRDCEFHGVMLRQNDIVTLHTPSAGRDADRFDDPDELHFDRTPNPHLAFGLGRHRCLGIHLARRELAIGLQELHRRIPDYSLDPQAPPVFNTGGMRGVFRLPLLLG